MAQLEADAQLAVRRTASTTLPFPSSSRDVTLYQELIVLYSTHWSNGTRGRRTRAVEPVQKQTVTVDWALSIDSPCSLVRPLAIVHADRSRSPCLSASASKFPHPQNPTFKAIDRPVQTHFSTYGEDELLRHPQLYELAFNSHPFLALIVCRTNFLGEVEERAHDKVLYDAILLAGLGVKEALSQNGPSTHVQAYGLPNMDDVVRRVTGALYSNRLGSLKAASLHTSAQCMMLLAWHELTHGLVRRAATWWTMICGVIRRIHALREQEEVRPDCQVNGIDLSLVVAEELDHMQTISHLVLLWLELHLGAIPAQTSIGSAASQPSESFPSWMLELDNRSGKISAMEAYQRSWVLLRSIERVLGSLTETMHEWKVANGVMDTRALPAIGQQDDATSRVHAILTQARLLQSATSQGASSIEPSAAALISLTALLACFQFRHAPISISAQSVINIVKVCSAITLQLREAFGDSEHATIPPARTSSAGTTKDTSSGAAYFSETMDGCRVVLTMIETIALTFELLLAHVDGDRVGDWLDTSEVVHWSLEAQQVVAEKLGSVLGILSTIKECVDNIRKQGRRPTHVLGMLERMQERLEKLGVQPDVSFAFEVAFAQDEISAGEGGGMKKEPMPSVPAYEMVPLHCSPTNEASFEGAGQWHAQPYTMSPVEYHSGLTAAYPTPPYMHTNLAAPVKSPLTYGPGPLPTSRNDQPEPASSSSHTNWYGGNLRLAYQDQAPAWRGAGHTEFSTLMSGAERFEAASGGGFKGVLPSMVFGEGMVERMQQGVEDAGGLRATQSRAVGRAGEMQSGSQLPYYVYDSRAPLGFSTTSAHPMWARYDSTHAQPAAARYDVDHAADPRETKRARIDPHTRPLQWDSHKVTRPRGMSDASTSQAGFTFVSEPMATARAADRSMESRQLLPAAEALASIQGIEPLTDDVQTGSYRQGKGKGRASTGSISSAITSTTLSSVSSLSDDDDEYVDDHGAASE
ncbi:uncharacterized protein SRS1_15678 [Sporisorium reilianum f. sp. reilianum]|uniref:Transcription factor domain-containing protein n=1 Tax=Sporisorium reilianum f. sp. reilianum TaxID=72559 RepID=A0A2N8UKE9_9BASI|nr:uncharacterized protein SRS1_15678 [Sporisorium reilianum f. sp. reilianum]